MPTLCPVPVQCTEGFRHIAVDGGESQNQCGVETPGLSTLGLLCPAAQPSPPADDTSMPYAHTQGPNAVATMLVQGGRPSQVDIQEIGPKHVDLQLAIKPRVAAHTPAGVEVRDFIANIHSVQA